MADEKDLNKGEKDASSDGDQSEEETSGDTVEVPKSELEQLKEERENYKKGMLSKKQELSEIKNKLSDDDEEEEGLPSGGEDEDEPLTKGEFHRRNEKEAVSDFFEENSEAQDHSSEFIEFYHPKRGKDTADAIKKDLESAWEDYKRDNPEAVEEGEDNSEAADLASNKTKPAGSSDKGKAKDKKGGVLPSRSGPEDWYDSE